MIFKLTYQKKEYPFRIKAKMNGIMRYITDVELQDIFFEQDKLMEDGYIDSFYSEKCLLIELLDGRFIETSLFKYVLPMSESDRNETNTRLVIGDSEANDWVDDDIDFVSALVSYVIQIQTNIFSGITVPSDFEEEEDLDELFADLKTIH